MLAIAAARLGFGPVTALDADQLAVEATEQNAAVNGVDLDARRARRTCATSRRPPPTWSWPT